MLTTNRHIKLSDFGISKLYKATDLLDMHEFKIGQRNDWKSVSNCVKEMLKDVGNVDTDDIVRCFNLLPSNYNDIRCHQFFDSILWTKLEKGEGEPPNWNLLGKF